MKESIENQVRGYKVLGPIASYRKRAYIFILASLLLPYYFGGGVNGNKAETTIGVAVFLVIAIFIFYGHRWAMMVYIAVFLVFGLILIPQVLSSNGDIIFTGTPAGVGKVSIGDNLECYLENEKMLSCEIR